MNCGAGRGRDHAGPAALRVIDHHVNDYIARARIAKAA